MPSYEAKEDLRAASPPSNSRSAPPREATSIKQPRTVESGQLRMERGVRVAVDVGQRDSLRRHAGRVESLEHLPGRRAEFEVADHGCAGPPVGEACSLEHSAL